MMSFFRFFPPALFGLAILSACTPDFIEAPDLDQIRAEDIRAIDQFLADRGWEADTTLSGARYVIFKNTDSTKVTIKQNDIVSFDFIGFFMDGKVFTTSLQSVADTVFGSTESWIFKPQSYTYTETGWTLRYVPIVSQYLEGPNQSTALMEAISISFGQMTAGDDVVVLLPSYEATTFGNANNPKPVYYVFGIAGVLAAE